MVQLGSGDTYSSVDNFLVGLYALMWALPFLPLMEKLQPTIEQIVLRHRQISISETDLLHATRGNFSEIYHGLMGLMIKGEYGETEAFVERNWDSLSADCVSLVII